MKEPSFDSWLDQQYEDHFGKGYPPLDAESDLDFDEEPEEDFREPDDRDCDHWTSNCYGRA